MRNPLRSLASRVASRLSSSSADTAASNTTAWNPSGWWWCLDHRRAENPPDVPGNRRLGPYDSAADAEHWRERLDRRNDEWDEADRRWAGD